MEADRGAGPSEFDRALADFTDEGRRRDAASARLQQADHTVISGMSGSWVGTLIELAETGRPVLAITRSGAHHRGVILAVGPDLVVLAPTMTGPRILLAHRAVDAIRENGDGRTRSEPVPRSGPDLAGLLDDAAEEHARVTVLTAGGNRFSGHILRVGEDQLTIRLDGEHDALTLPLAGIDEAVIDQ